MNPKSIANFEMAEDKDYENWFEKSLFLLNGNYSFINERFINISF